MSGGDDDEIRIILEHLAKLAGQPPPPVQPVQALSYLTPARGSSTLAFRKKKDFSRLQSLEIWLHESIAFASDSLRTEIGK